jgi:acetate kinase
MKILVLNSGSSSLKYQLFSMPEEAVICSGIVERIGEIHAQLKHMHGQRQHKETKAIADHREALKMVLRLLMHETYGGVSSVDEIAAVGHRVVHGGYVFQNTEVLDAAAQKTIEEFSKLAPLHNPANLLGIRVAETVFPKAMQVGVFDTAFHQTIPKKAYSYAIPHELTEQHHIRMFGFHGTSHKYVSEKAREFLKLQRTKIITIHLGNGCSITAVNNGKSVDHSLGFSPVNGLIMGTRSGDIDHSLIFYLVENLGYDIKQVDKLLQTNSGLLGISGYSDLRDVISEAEKGNERCQLALEMSVYRIKKYIGAYTAAMNGLDCIVFTAGIGENSQLIRKMVCRDMDSLGLILDDSKNTNVASHISDISHQESKVRILVIPTNEELEIAKQTYLKYQEIS